MSFAAPFWSFGALSEPTQQAPRDRYSLCFWACYRAPIFPIGASLDRTHPNKPVTGHVRGIWDWGCMGGGHGTTSASPAQISEIPIISAPAPRHCARAVKGMDSKSIGLCPQGLESPRCRLLLQWQREFAHVAAAAGAEVAGPTLASTADQKL